MGLLKARVEDEKTTRQPRRRGCRMLVNELAAPDAARRRIAARELSRHPEAVPALDAAMAGEEDHGVLEALVATLSEIGTPAAVAALLTHIRAEDAWLRNAVVTALQEIGPEAASAIKSRLQDPDPDVRIAAVVALSGLRCPEAAQWTLALLDCETDVNVCASAIEALDQLSGPQALAVLDQVTERFQDEPFLVFAAQAVRGRLSGDGTA